MKKTLLLCAFLVGLVSSNVMALTLDEARTQGRVGETFYGYLVALKTDAETLELVKDINEARNLSYQQLAKQNNVSTDEIAKLAGQKWLLARSRENMCRGLMENGCKNNFISISIFIMLRHFVNI